MFPKLKKFFPSYLVNHQTNDPQASLPHWLQGLTLGAVTIASIVLPFNKQTLAQTLYFLYPPIKEPLRVESLDIFAREGEINRNLGFFLDLARTNEEAQLKFREALNTPAALEPLLVSRFFNSNLGEEILTRVGDTIQIEGGRNGKYALRGALVAAAFDDEGLSLINFFRKLPTNIQFDLQKILEISQSTEKAVAATKLFSEVVIPQLSAAEAAAAEPVNFADLRDLRERGGHSVKERKWTLTDKSRERSFHVDLYQPARSQRDNTPVLIISHGLGSTTEEFAPIAQHLASYGFVVAVPQHIGSDSEQKDALFSGLSREVFLTSEFIDRPLDISYVIDELERRNLEEFDGKLVLDKVGVFGHSFGGYTALAIAGATIDFDHLERECTIGEGRLNTALLLQCQALDLERQEYNFRDERVVAVLGHNPVNRTIFGPQGLSSIQIPILLGAGSYDPATPFVYEQLDSFTWLTSANKYLMLQEGQTHIDLSTIDGGMSEVIDSVEEIVLPETQLLQDYSHATVLAFAEVYVVNDPDYLPYIQSSYLNYLSQGQKFKTYLISEDSSEKLVDEIAKSKFED
ncbi:putative dienelactone hydrolase [Xenococcus sp. PCC 7305]|nr:putative dienelactone hydrolase [Xenococcus sp. PCC 7305]